MRNVRAAASWFMFCCLPMTASAEEPVDPAASAQSQAAAKEVYQNQLICKTKAVVGSHIPKRICKTQAQIDAERARAARMLREVQAPHPVSGVGEAGRGN
jgi:hypothetical protein